MSVFDELRKMNLVCWGILTAVWALGMLSSKRTARSQGYASRVGQAGMILVAFYLLFSDANRWLAVDPVVVSINTATAVFGCLLTVAGVALAIWARCVLGTNWSGVITIKQAHKLVITGPYEYVRHPIYTGVLISAFGTALLRGRLLNIVGLAVCFVALSLKIRTEELFMVDQFGAEYVSYRRRVKALAPLLF